MTRSELAMAALACAAVPGMKPVSVVGIRASDAAAEQEVQRAVVEDTTGRSWVVHSPLNAVAGARLQRHDELVRQLPRHVPFKVPAAVGYASAGRYGPAVVYPFIEGMPLDLGRLPAGPGLASAVGRTIAAIHNIPRPVFEQQDVPVLEAADVRRHAVAEVDRAAETGRVPTGLLARWEEAFDAAALWQFATTPVHGAFGGSSLLVTFSDQEDAASGRVVAVLGWDAACVGDPATDLAEIYLKAAPAAWDAVLDSYSLARAQRPDPYLQTRATLVSELRTLHGLATAVENGQNEVVRRCVEALRRLDRLTEDEASLVPTHARHLGGATPSPPDTSPHGGQAEQTVDVPTRTERPSPETDDISATEPRRDDSTDETLAVIDEDLDATSVPAGVDEDDERSAEKAVDERADDDAEHAPTQGDIEEHDGPSTEEAEDLDDTTRLHELYGMPDTSPEIESSDESDRGDGQGDDVETRATTERDSEDDAERQGR